MPEAWVLAEVLGLISCVHTVEREVEEVEGQFPE